MPTWIICKTNAERLYTQTDKGIMGAFGGTSFGDIAFVPATWLKHPKGIRDIQEWYISTSLRRDYVYKVFERQCEIALANLEKIHAVVGEKVCGVFVTGTDFGTQSGPFISPKAYRDLFQPFHRAVNDWVHKHTTWKTWIHSCGSIMALMNDFVDAGFDILNPVQCSANDMAPADLKRKFGEKITFWGGGVDTQRTLPFGTPQEVREEVKRADQDVRPRRRVRLQHHPQRPGEHSRRKPRSPLRNRARLRRVPGVADGSETRISRMRTEGTEGTTCQSALVGCPGPRSCRSRARTDRIPPAPSTRIESLSR